MRYWLTAMVTALFPGLGVQDGKPVDTPPATSAPEHKVCGADDSTAKTTVILPGYGTGGFPITTKVPQAQAFFYNGMQLAAAFAHKAAIAAFQQSRRLDPDCAMCAWGEAWSSGPTINYGVEKADAVKLAAITAEAESLAKAAGTPLERALIAALKTRYVAPKKGATDDMAFAMAMDAIATANAASDALQVVSADAWMMAASQWGKGALDLMRAETRLETVLARDPDYTPAIHFYIHVTEGLEHPAKATRYADQLQRLAPKASHLVHMPSHTYYWIGRYEDAAKANVEAVALGIDNAKRLGMTMPDGVWDLPYHSHNVHFGVGGAMMSGDGKIALALSEPLIRVAQVRDKGGVFGQAVAGMGYAAIGRHADPAEALKLPEPKLKYMKAFWHYGRGEALARKGDTAGVRSEAAAILTALKAGGKDKLDDAIGVKMVRIAALVLAGRAEMLGGRPERAYRAFRSAAKLEESKSFTRASDPPLWWYPPRRSMAEARLMMGDAKGALAEADTTLRRRPNDPMTLAVRAKAQAALGDRAAARIDARRALAGWRGERRAFDAALI